MRRGNCETEARQPELRRRQTLSGIDSVEYDPARTGREVVRVYFIGSVPAENGVRVFPKKEQIVITGDRRGDRIRVKGIEREYKAGDAAFESDGAGDDFMDIELENRGGFGAYTLRLEETDRRGEPTGETLAGFDPLYGSAPLSFREHCDPPADCALLIDDCLPDTDSGTGGAANAPRIDYLAKDFPTFRQTMLDRLALLLPDWEEGRTRHLPDMGITLIELLAYVGDYLSYWQDAVGTEAYLRTARRRISVRRHARLVDYRLGDGCNARVWVHCHIDGGGLDISPDEIAFFTARRQGGGTPDWDKNELNFVVPGQAVTIVAADLERVVPSPAVFTPLLFEQDTISLIPAQNAIRLYTWGERGCGLPQGATSATLYLLPQLVTKEADGGQSEVWEIPAQSDLEAIGLKVGDALLLEENKGRDSGDWRDRDTTRRHVVRLTRVSYTQDLLYSKTGRDEGALPVIEIAWDAADALPFPLCLSARKKDGTWIEDIAVARGNMILCDHGREAKAYRFEDDECPLPLPPPRPGETSFTPITQRTAFPDFAQSALRQSDNLRELLMQMQTAAMKANDAAGNAPLTEEEAQRSRRDLRRLVALMRRALGGDLLEKGKDGTIGEREEAAILLGEMAQNILESLGGNRLLGGASAATLQNAANALPVLNLYRAEDYERRQEYADKGEAIPVWTPTHDLLSSGSNDRHFVAESDDEGRLQLRFGDGERGEIPPPLTELVAVWREGNGAAGNVGAETITGVAFRNPTSGVSLTPRNPLPAVGGTDPETLAEAKRNTPRTFRSRLERAVTPDDYARLVERHPQVQRAAARFCWTGSRDEIQIAVDVRGAEVVPPALAEELLRSLQIYRRIGHDVRIVAPRYVGIAIEIEVCAEANAIASDVQRELLRLFGSGRRRDNSPALFHPDRLTFGGDVTVSGIERAALGVSGVASVKVQALYRVREGKSDSRAVSGGVLPIGTLEIARLNNDRDDRHLGEVKVTVKGGR